MKRSHGEADEADDPGPTEGVLVVLGTPIGNLSDLSFRATQTLRTADLIVAEDSRQARKLLSHLEIRGKKTASLLGKTRIDPSEIPAMIASGSRVVVVSDAGMPGVSDPGAEVVAAARSAGLRVEVVPGPSALTAAVALADFDLTEFRFGGFLPAQHSRRVDYLEATKRMGLALIVFEAPHRIKESLEDVAEVYGADHRILLAKEITKLHESSLSATVALVSESAMVNPPRGEYVLVISGAGRGPSSATEVDRVARILAGSGLKVKDASVVLAEIADVPRSVAYDAMLRAK